MSDRDREIERLTEVFKDAILHAPIPDVNPNLIRTVESQARECALRVVGDEPAEQEYLQGHYDLALLDGTADQTCLCDHPRDLHDGGGGYCRRDDPGSGWMCACIQFRPAAVL